MPLAQLRHPPRRSCHDRQRAAKMKEIGLQPFTTGEPGGKETGPSVTHYILPGGPNAKAYAKLKAKGFQLHWQSAPAGQQAKAKKASKTKFTCPDCAQNAWSRARWLLLTRWLNLNSGKRQELSSLFGLNRKLFKAYVLKESLDRLWNYVTKARC